jgi:hypothetical protein
MKKTINGWNIQEIPLGWEFRYRIFNGVMEYKAYTLQQAISIAKAGGA